MKYLGLGLAVSLIALSANAHPVPSGHWGTIIRNKNGETCWSYHQHYPDEVLRDLKRSGSCKDVTPIPNNSFYGRADFAIQGWIALYSTADNKSYGLGKGKTMHEAQWMAHKNCKAHASQCFLRLVFNTNPGSGSKPLVNFTNEQ